MQRSLSQHLTQLLDSTDSLGVGCVDQNGFVLETKGGHAGRNAQELACYLSHSKPDSVAEHLGDLVGEQIILGSENHLYLRWLPNQYLLYVMTHPQARGGAIRHALYKKAKQIYQIIQESASCKTFAERLEQPRKFMSFPPSSKAGERVFQKLHTS